MNGATETLKAVVAAKRWRLKLKLGISVAGTSLNTGAFALTYALGTKNWTGPGIMFGAIFLAMGIYSASELRALRRIHPAPHSPEIC